VVTRLPTVEHTAADRPGLTMRVLELGAYIAPAAAGSYLLGQGWHVTKWVHPTDLDPIITHQRGGRALWEFYTEGKEIVPRLAGEVIDLGSSAPFDVVIDNHRPEAWRRWGVDLAERAARLGVTWVSIRDDLGGRGFDVVAQARAWGVDAPPVPFFIGDTTAGLMAAFVAATHVARGEAGHWVVGQAGALAALREGELAVRPPDPIGWHDPADYRLGGLGGDRPGAHVAYRGHLIHEPLRDDVWRDEHLDHADGRLVQGRRTDRHPPTGDPR
jgi:hypothetical protein